MAGLYIHIPFCHSKCFYCDFYSTPNIENMSQYIDAILIELRLRLVEIRNDISTIYIGGGTPSILPIKLLQKIHQELSEHIDIRQLDEFTIEANPEDVTPEWVKSINKLGINRVSIGIQSFDNRELCAINRRHSSEDACNAIDILRQYGITNISGDLIYGLPGQDIDSWKRSLNKLISLRLPHFSAYLLSYEPGTRLYARLKTGKIEEASEGLVNEMYQYLIIEARNNDYDHYEISNFSISGKAAVHNSNYWKDLPYLGIGVSAHSFDGKNRKYNPSNIKKYISQLHQSKCAYEIEVEDATTRHNDYIIVSLRTSRGIDLKFYQQRFGFNLLKIAKPYIDSGQMVLSDTHLAIAEKSMLISDHIMLDFIR